MKKMFAVLSLAGFIVGCSPVRPSLYYSVRLQTQPPVSNLRVMGSTNASFFVDTKTDERGIAWLTIPESTEVITVEVLVSNKSVWQDTFKPSPGMSRVVTF